MTAPARPAEGSALAPGVRLGPYEVLGPIGSGGMGEVYRARDERLGRDVAVKVLPLESSTDPDRLRRFAQEAKAAGVLNHPNLVAVFDVGRHEGNPYVVFELLEGETLRTRLRAGALPLRDTIGYATQIASGLAAAHQRGIVHRDLKPENLLVTKDGRVKILDFGLAKLSQPERLLQETGVAVAKELTTASGAILGTAGYMSPEQIRGQPVDHRSDVFSYGAVLYEMLCGRRAFHGETPADTLTAILRQDPPELSGMGQEIPPALDRITRRCLEKDPAERFQSAQDIGFALEAASGSRSIERPRARLGLIAAALAAVAVIGGLFAWRLGQPQPTHEPAATGVTRFTWSLPAGLELDGAPVVSPDSRSIAFTATDASGTRLFVRALDRLEASAVPGTEGAKQPFWSPDSRSLGYFANGSLMKVALASGAPVRICDAPEARGGTWSRSGVIVFTPAMIDTALARVSAAGGQAEPATLLDVSQGEDSHRWPAFLADGVHFLYFVHSSVDERRGVYLGRVDRPATRPPSPLFRSESEAVYAPLPGRDRGVLLSVEDGRIAARPFDAARLALDGDPRMIDLPAGDHTISHPAMLSASADVLAAVSSPIPSGSRLASSGRNGENLRLWEERESQFWPRLSPDGRWLARQRLGHTPALWVEDLERGTRVRVATVGLLPVWSPDGTRLAYVAGTRFKPQLSLIAADGTGEVTVRPCPRAYCIPTDWSPDGQSLIVNLADSLDGNWDVWALSPDPNGAAQPLLADPFTERDARLSPDGRFIVYVSEESGRPEVSVRRLSGPPRRIVISGGGGDQPVWRRDGRELLFLDSQDRLRSVAVGPGEGSNLTFGVPVQLKVPPISRGHWGTQYDVSPDGRRLYFLDRTREPAPREIAVVVGWRAILGPASTQAAAP